MGEKPLWSGQGGQGNNPASLLLPVPIPGYPSLRGLGIPCACLCGSKGPSKSEPRALHVAHRFPVLLSQFLPAASSHLLLCQLRLSPLIHRRGGQGSIYAAKGSLLGEGVKKGRGKDGGRASKDQSWARGKLEQVSWEAQQGSGRPRAGDSLRARFVAYSQGVLIQCAPCLSSSSLLSLLALAGTKGHLPSLTDLSDWPSSNPSVSSAAPLPRILLSPRAASFIVVTD